MWNIPFIKKYLEKKFDIQAERIFEVRSSYIAYQKVGAKNGERTLKNYGTDMVSSIFNPEYRRVVLNSLIAMFVFGIPAVVLATDITATNNLDSYISSPQPTTNYGSATTTDLDRRSSNTRRGVGKFTMPAGSGIISDVKLYLYSFATELGGPNDIHQLTELNMVESEVTWQRASTATDWTDGGSFNATVIDSATTAVGWVTFVLMGTGATNPLTLNWGDVIGYLIKYPSEDGTYDWWGYFTKEYAVDTAKRPYLEITYAPAPKQSSLLLMGA